MDGLKKKTLSGFFYKFMERGAAQGVNFLVQIILARILMPEEFGTIALLTVFIHILDVFVTFGFGNSLIVNKKSDELDFSTCFYFGIFLALTIYGIVYFTSPFISDYFYGKDELDLLIKVMALRIPIAAVNSVQHAYVAKHMRFRLFFYATLIGTILSGIISIIMAYSGFGVWALVAQYLGNSVIDTVSLWFFAKWRPRWMFSFKRLKAIYDYGWKILVVGLIDTVFNQIRSLVIAKHYSKADLAYYNRGVSFPSFGMKLIEPTINTVLFPALSSCNDNPMMMKSITQRVIKTSTYVITAIMGLLAAIAKPLVVVLLTEKWLDCVIFLQIGCLGYLFRPLQVINNCIIRASGRSGLLLKLDILKKGIGIALLLISMRYGVVVIAWTYVLTNIIATFINIYPNRDILKYGYREQFRDLAENLVVGVIVFLAVWLLTLLPIKALPTLVLQCLLGVALFVGLSKLFKVDSYDYLKQLIFKQMGSKLERKKKESNDESI